MTKTEVENERDKIVYAVISYLVWVDPCEFFFLILPLTKIQRVEELEGNYFLSFQVT